MHETNQATDVDPDATTDDRPARTISRATEGDGEGSGSGPAIRARRRSLLHAVAVIPFAAPFPKRSDSRGDGPSEAGRPPNHTGTGPHDSGEQGPTKSGDDLWVGDTRPFSVVATLPERYAMAIEINGEMATRVTGRVDGADQFIRTKFPGGTTESYFVDGTLYVVSGEGCIAYSDVTDSVGGGGNREPTPRPDPRVEVTAITTVDGRETLVLELVEWPHELPAPAREARREHAEGIGVERQRTQPNVTYYLDAETGYLRRLEAADATVDYHSWDDVEPVTEPDVPCSEGELHST